MGLRDSATRDDSLAGRDGEVFARTHRLAVSALHTSINFAFDRGRRLQVLEVQVGIVAQDDVGVQDSSRVDGVLNVEHDLVQLGPVLSLYERSHDASRAVLSLERASRCKNHLNHVFGEGSVARDIRGRLKIFVDQKVDVAVFGMPKNHRVGISVNLEQANQFRAGL